MPRFEELAAKRQKWVDSSRENDFRDGIADLLVHQYSTKAHFIFELLQNADDAEAEEAVLILEEDKLVFTHDGKKLFNDDNVESITSIGKSTKEFTDIGKHGIGFKSVFAFTHAPRIHSGEKHFDIIDVVVPIRVSQEDIPEDLKPNETRIFLPFDSDDIPDSRRFRKLIFADEAVRDISVALSKLNARILIFLRHVKKIRWVAPNGASGILLRDPPKIIMENANYVDIVDDSGAENWIVFDRKLKIEDESKLHEVSVKVAFLIHEGKVRRAQNTELVVYLPTEKKTGLGFLVHGPFKTTKARDNIANPNEDKANRELINVAALLAADSLEILRDLGLLSVESYNALPLRLADIGWPFCPFYDVIHLAMKTKKLLPPHDDDYVYANQAKLARGKELADVFAPDQLGSLFEKEKLFWIDTAITEGGSMQDLHVYLTGKRKIWPKNEWEQEPLCAGIEIEAKELAGKLTKEFFQSQDESWLVKFYRYMSTNYAPFNDSAFLRLENGSHVSPGKTAAPNAWLPSSNLTVSDQTIFHSVKKTLAQKTEVAEFLKGKVGLREPNPVDIVKKCILPKFKQEQDPLSEEQVEDWRSDFKRILAIVNESADNKSALIPELKQHYIILVEQSVTGVRKLVRAGVAYLHSEETDCFFQGNASVKFVPVDMGTQFRELLLALDVVESPRVMKPNAVNYRDHVTLCSTFGWHKRGLDGFDPEWTIDGLDFAAENPTIDRSRILWHLITKDRKCIRGTVEKSSTKTYENAQTPEHLISATGALLINNAWLPDKKGEFHRPAELLLEDLPDSFEKESSSELELADKLGMKQPERMQAFDLLAGGDLRKKKILEAIAASEEKELEKFEKLIPREQPPPGDVTSFREGVKSLRRFQRQAPSENSLPPDGVRDSERYQEKLDAETQNAVEEATTQPRTIRFSLVRAQDSNSEARDFLYQQYDGRCQVTGETFVKANGKNYFEAVTLVPRLDAVHLNNAGNMLCLSAETAAKFFHGISDWPADLETKILEFKTEKDGGTLEQRQLRIQLVGQEATITWTEQHFMRLISLWRHA